MVENFIKGNENSLLAPWSLDSFLNVTATWSHLETYFLTPDKPLFAVGNDRNRKVWDADRIHFIFPFSTFFVTALFDKLGRQLGLNYCGNSKAYNWKGSWEFATVRNTTRRNYQTKPEWNVSEECLQSIQVSAPRYVHLRPAFHPSTPPFVLF